jgi:hypothetical protein
VVLPAAPSIGSSVVLHQNFSERACYQQHPIVAMAKTKDKLPARTKSQSKSDTSFIKIDKKAFDPTLASLFASSVRLPPAELSEQPL